VLINFKSLTDITWEHHSHFIHCLCIVARICHSLFVHCRPRSHPPSRRTTTHEGQTCSRRMIFAFVAWNKNVCLESGLLVHPVVTYGCFILLFCSKAFHVVMKIYLLSVGYIEITCFLDKMFSVIFAQRGIEIMFTTYPFSLCVWKY
jgi:hypothetical protein